VLLITLVVLLILSRWIGALVRASPIGGVDRSLGLVFGLARGAALVILAYIAAGMVIPLERWPEPVLDARSLYLAYQGAHWVREKLPVEYRPRLYAPLRQASSRMTSSTTSAACSASGTCLTRRRSQPSASMRSSIVARNPQV
jgi:uncharacterized membrane protein required for colicin V production